MFNFKTRIDATEDTPLKHWEQVLTTLSAGVLIIGILGWPCSGVAARMGHRHDWQNPQVAELFMSAGMIAAAIHFAVLLIASTAENMKHPRIALAILLIGALGSVGTYYGLYRWGSEELEVRYPVHEVDKFESEEQRELLIAIADGNDLKVRQWAIDGNDLNFRGSSGSNPLHVAYAARDLDMFQLLLDLGADHDRNHRFGRDVRDSIVRTGNLEWLTVLLDSGMDPNSKIGSRKTPLIVIAASSNNLDILQLLLGRGADLEAIGSSRTNTLQSAISWDHWKVARFLLPKVSANQRQITLDMMKRNSNFVGASRATSERAEFIKLLEQAVQKDELAP